MKRRLLARAVACVAMLSACGSDSTLTEPTLTSEPPPTSSVPSELPVCDPSTIEYVPVEDIDGLRRFMTDAVIAEVLSVDEPTEFIEEAPDVSPLVYTPVTYRVRQVLLGEIALEAEFRLAEFPDLDSDTDGARMRRQLIVPGAKFLLLLGPTDPGDNDLAYMQVDRMLVDHDGLIRAIDSCGRGGAFLDRTSFDDFVAALAE